MQFLNSLCKFIIKLFWSKLTHAEKICAKWFIFNLNALCFPKFTYSQRTQTNKKSDELKLVYDQAGSTLELLAETVLIVLIKMQNW